MTNLGTEVKVNRILDDTYGFIYKIDVNGNGNGYLYELDGVKYLSIFGDMIISSWERKVTTPMLEAMQLADDDTTFVKCKPSGVYKENRILCDDFTIVNISGGTVSDLTTCYIEEKDADDNSFDPIRYSSTLKPGFKTQYQFYLDNIGNPVIFKAVYDVIKTRI
jgi:hypothetical protein